MPPAPGLDASIVLYSPGELSPGAWRRAEAALNVPEYARRLTIPIGDPLTPHFTQSRALATGDAIRFLLALGELPVRPSVRAWQIAAHIARRLHEHVMLPRGDAQTDQQLAAFASKLPAGARAVLVEVIESNDDLLGAYAPGADSEGFAQLSGDALLDSFLSSAELALAAGALTRKPQQIRAKTKRVAAPVLLRLADPSPKTGSEWLVEASVMHDELARVQEALDFVGEQFAPLARIDRTKLRRGNGTSIAEPLELTVEEASALIASADRLADHGVGVELPESLARGLDGRIDARLRIRSGHTSRGSSRGTGAFRLDSLVTYDLSVALGGVEVDAAELRRLAAEARAVVRVAGGEWIALTDQTRDQLAQLARAVESHDANMANSKAIAATLAGSTQIVSGVRAVIEQVDDESLREVLAHLRGAASFPELAEIPGFHGELRPYQRRGVNWLAGMSSLPLGACLCDDMGLGKTVQIIALLCHLRDRAAKAALAAEPADDGTQPSDPAPPRVRTLVVCPTSLIGNWQREIQRFAPDLNIHVHHGPARTVEPSPFLDADVTITSYGLVSRDRDLLAGVEWSVCVFDEAQAVKNVDTEQARSVRALRAGFRVALTGTPMENRLLELWAILDLVNPSLLGTAAVFNRRFVMPIERAADDEATSTLRRITAPFLLRRVKSDPTIAPDLPGKQEQTVVCTLTTEQAALYQATVDEALAVVRSRDGIGRRGAVLSLLTKLKQVCNHPAQMLGQTEPLDGRSGKLERLSEMLEEVVAEGERALVFSQYAKMGSLLTSYLPERVGCEALFLHGGVTRQKREDLVARFQADDDEPLIFVLSLKAGGLGLNLMRAAHVFHYDRWWNPAVEDQATDRTHRIGQTRNIQVHKLVCAGTLEERIDKIVEGKRKLAGRVIDAVSAESAVTELGDDELEELVSLSTSAV